MPSYQCFYVLFYVIFFWVAVAAEQRACWTGLQIFKINGTVQEALTAGGQMCVKALAE